MRILQATRAALIIQLGINKTLLLVRDGGPRHLAISNVSALSAAQRSRLVIQRTQMLHNASISCHVPCVAGSGAGLPSVRPRCARKRLLAETTSTHSASFNSKRLEDHVPLCAAGFDAVRLLRRDDDDGDAMGEVVDCRPQCTAAYLKGACVDGLRAGWDGRRPCECNDSFPILNCFGKQLPPWRAGVQATAHVPSGITRCRA